MKNENNIELISPIGETCNKVDLKKVKKYMEYKCEFK